jgi:hypothetical protein
VLRVTAHKSFQLRRGQNRGYQDYRLLFLRTMRYSLRRALSLDSVDGGTHNPTVGIYQQKFFQAELTSGNGSNYPVSSISNENETWSCSSDFSPQISPQNELILVIIPEPSSAELG